MKKLLTVTAATLAVFEAHAADLPARMAPPIAAPLPFTWTGFYIGANIGALVNDSALRSEPGGTLIPPSIIAITGIEQFTRTSRFQDTSVAGGGQIGVNYQMGPGGVPFLPGGSLVVGIEADFQGTGARETLSFFDVGVFPPGEGNLTTTFTQRIDYFGTVRGRLGFAVDRVFVYATGGFAYGEVKTSASFAFAGPFFEGTQFGGATSGLRTGYTYGGGVEYAVPSNGFFGFLNAFSSSAVTLKAEYLYVGLSDRSLIAFQTDPGSFLSASVPTDLFGIRREANFHVGRVGINFKF